MIHPDDDADEVQLDLFTDGLVRHDAPATSAEAGARIDNLAATYRRILLALSPGERTAHEISRRTGISGDTLRPRLLELAGLARNRPQFETTPLIERTDNTEPTPSGRRAFTWRITQAGSEALDREIKRAQEAA